MTLPQWLSIGTLAGMMALFLWGRFRYDVTAVIALLAALALGIVKFEDAFKGFSDDIVIIVGSALVMSAAVQRCCHQDVSRPAMRNHCRPPDSSMVRDPHCLTNAANASDIWLDDP